MKSKEVFLKITGTVQGVFYRASTKQKAIELNLKGWVKNCKDGSVEAVFQGGEEAISSMIDWCWEGPSNAKVEHIHILEHSLHSSFYNFSIR